MLKILFSLLIISFFATNSFAKEPLNAIDIESAQEIVVTGSTGMLLQRKMVRTGFFKRKDCVMTNIGNITNLDRVKTGDKLEINGASLTVGEISVQTFNQNAETDKRGKSAGCLASENGYDQHACEITWAIFNKCTKAR